MQISSGLFDAIILQRTAGDVSAAAITGRCAGAGAVTARVCGAAGVLAELDGAVVGQATGETFTAMLAGIPVGGPYTVTLAVGDEKLTVADVLVGDVWIAAGQSNMEGCGDLRYAATPIPQVHAFYMHDCWGVAQDPLHTLWNTVDRVHAEIFGMPPSPPSGTPLRGAGPALPFAQEMYRQTGIPQGIIACAHGGTSMAQWDPKLKRKGGGSLYGATLRRVQKNGGRVAGMIWYQGCSDASPADAALYTARMKALIRNLRNDLHSPTLPVAIVQISRLYNCGGPSPAWNAIQDQQRRLPDVIPHTTTVAAIDLALDDAIHIGAPDVNRLGARLGTAMHALVTGDPSAKPISVKKITTATNRITGTADVIVEFANVVGALQAAGRPEGLTLVDTNSAQHVYRVDLDGNRAILHTSFTPEELYSKELWYGYGMAPYCNITDAADRALPVFGPLPAGAPRALTPYVRALRVSRPEPAPHPLTALAYPANVPLQTWSTEKDFCDQHLLISGTAPRELAIYHACRFTCTEPMKLLALVGYDGPVRVWLDGQPVYHDPDGATPARPDKGSIPFAAAADSHEIIVALGTNHGLAWGIFLRFERTDLRQRQIERGDYVLPVIEG